MSDAHATSHAGHEPVRSEEDRISTGTLLLVGIGSLVVFLVAGWAAVSYLHARQVEHGPLPVPAEAGTSKVGLVEQDFFDVATRGKRQQATKLERLGSWGWVDRGAGVVHMPIDRAMELVTQGVRPGATTPGAQP